MRRGIADTTMLSVYYSICIVVSTICILYSSMQQGLNGIVKHCGTVDGRLWLMALGHNRHKCTYAHVGTYRTGGQPQSPFSQTINITAMCN